MATVTRHIKASPDEVWAVLANGWLYTNWVVGTSRIRDVDATWPATGTSLHHSFGIWPMVINDRADVKESVSGQRLVLRTRAWRTTRQAQHGKPGSTRIPRYGRRRALSWHVG